MPSASTGECVCECFKLFYLYVIYFPPACTLNNNRRKINEMQKELSGDDYNFSIILPTRRIYHENVYKCRRFRGGTRFCRKHVKLFLFMENVKALKMWSVTGKHHSLWVDGKASLLCFFYDKKTLTFKSTWTLEISVCCEMWIQWGIIYCALQRKRTVPMKGNQETKERDYKTNLDLSGLWYGARFSFKII